LTGDTRANGTLMAVGGDGNVAFFSEAGTHLLADVTGYFMGPTV
jgi:hypothetical protein